MTKSIFLLFIPIMILQSCITSLQPHLGHISIKRLPAESFAWYSRCLLCLGDLVPGRFGMGDSACERRATHLQSK